MLFFCAFYSVHKRWKNTNNIAPMRKIGEGANMSKKINFGTINDAAMELLSKYHVAYLNLKGLHSWYKAEKDKLEEEESGILEKRKAAIAGGMSTDEAIANNSIEDVQRRLRALKVQFDAECEPHKKAQKEGLALIDDNLYLSYMLCMNKGALGARGKLTLKKGKKSVEYTLEKSYKGIIADFLEKIGCKGQDNDTALNKFAQIMSARTSGMMDCTKGDDYIKVRSTIQYKKLFMHAFFQYVIREKGVVTVNDDGTLSMTVYDEEA